MINSALKLLKNGWVITGFCLFGLYQLFLLFVTVSYVKPVGFITANVKTEIALAEFLKPERQLNAMSDLLSLDMIVAMDGELYETTIRSDFYKESGLIFDKPNKPSEIIQIVPYRSLAEFQQINPHCCHTQIIRDSDSCFGMDPVEGGISSRRGYYTCVFINYKLRYLDENGHLIERETSRHSVAMMTSKGEIVRWE